MSTPLTAVLNRTAERPAPAPVATESDPKSADWGLAPEKKGMTRENKFILFILLILVSVFSFVVFRNFQKKAEKADGTETAKEGTEKPESGKPEKHKKGTGKKDDEVALKSETEQEHPRVEEEETTDSLVAGRSKKRSEAEDFPEESESEKRPSLSEPTELTGDPFKSTEDSADKQPAKITTRGRGHQQRTERAVVEEASLNGESAGQEPERALTISAPQQADSDSLADDKSFNLNDSPKDRATQSEAGAGADQRLSQGQADAFEATPTARAHRTNPRNHVAEESEGSAEPTELHVASAPQEMEPATTDGFTANSEFDSSVEQVGGTAEKGQQRIAKKAGPAVTRQEEFAQTDAASTMDEMGTQTIPRAGPTTARGTAPRGTIARGPGARASHGTTRASTVAQEEPLEDKLGGMQPHEVTRRPPAPRGSFDPQIDPLVANTGDYVIRPNDNFWRISRKVYGTPRYFEALRKHNEKTIGDSKNMKVGTHISTPPMDVLEQQYKDLLPVIAAPKPAGAAYDSPAAPKTSGFFIDTNNQKAYRVGPKDTLSGISQKLLGRSTRWEEIFELNKDRMQSYDQLTLGMILRLPEDAVQPKLIGTTDAAR